MPSAIVRAPLLDARLSAALELAGEPCAVCADIGADHGRLSAVMLLRGIARHALVADVSAKALEKARLCIHRLLLSDRATFAVADGLDALDALESGRAERIFILGMGGDTVSKILLRGRSRLHGASLILGAQTDCPLLRETLCTVGYRIRREMLARDAGRLYPLMQCTPALPDEPTYTEEELFLGPTLMRERPALWLESLKPRTSHLEKSIRAMETARLVKDYERLALFRRELDYVKAALAVSTDCHTRLSVNEKEGMKLEGHTGATDL